MNVLPVALGRSLRIGAVIAFAPLALLVPVSLAQMEDAPHPAHIHSGTCDTLGDVVAPLTDVAPASGEHVGAESAHAIKTGMTTVDMSLDDIIEGGHAINVHKSADEIDSYIACGDIGGTAVTDDDGRRHLLVGLGELNDSGHHGVAWLGDDGDKTEVSVSLIEPDKMS